MACCSSSSVPLDDGGIEFKKRSYNLPSIYGIEVQKRSSNLPSISVPADDKGIEVEKRSSNLPTFNEHRVALEDWNKQYEASERNLGRKQSICSSARSDLYQILGLFFVFQGVILTAVAQANLLTCHNWTLPFFLCLLTSVAAFGACLQKLKEIRDFTSQFRLERAHYRSLNRSIEKLKEEGINFDVCNGQPELKGPYRESQLSGKGTFDDLRSSFSRFCSVWIISYAGAVLLLLCVFSGLTLFSIHQILCNPGSKESVSPGRSR